MNRNLVIMTDSCQLFWENCKCRAFVGILGQGNPGSNKDKPNLGPFQVQLVPMRLIIARWQASAR